MDFSVYVRLSFKIVPSDESHRAWKLALALTVFLSSLCCHCFCLGPSELVEKE